MEIRDNVRRRRQARMMQLLDRDPQPSKRELAEVEAHSEPHPERLHVEHSHAGTTAEQSQQFQRHVRLSDDQPQADPEKWWKEKQSRLVRSGSLPSWQGADRLGAPSPPSDSDAGGSYVRKLIAGLGLRVLVAAIVYGAVWLSFQTEAPGSRFVRSWTADAVTRDMDFQAAEAWYTRYFGGSPSFLPVFRNRKEEPLAVSGSWNRSAAEPPVVGRIVRTFAQDGAGIRIAAAAGSDVKAAYAGRVVSVMADEDGRSTIAIQHAGQMVTEYGNVAEPAVHPDDWVLTGQRIGMIPKPKDASGQSLLLFAVKRNGGYMDPSEVVPFD